MCALAFISAMGAMQASPSDCEMRNMRQQHAATRPPHEAFAAALVVHEEERAEDLHGRDQWSRAKLWCGIRADVGRKQNVTKSLSMLRTVIRSAVDALPLLAGQSRDTAMYGLKLQTW